MADATIPPADVVPPPTDPAQEHYNIWKKAHPGMPQAVYDMVAMFFSMIWHGHVTP